MSIATFSEIQGLRGLLKIADEDPVVLELIRQYQLLLSPRRKVGGNIFEYRDILLARIESLRANHCLLSDSATTVLRVLHEHSKGVVSNRIITAVMGMITYDLNVGPAYTDAEVWDLFVPEGLRENSDVSLRLIEYCHAKFKKLGVTTVRVKLPHKRTHSFRRIYSKHGYTTTAWGGLEYRFKTEG